MEIEEIQSLKAELKAKMKLGDYVTLAEMLGVAQNTAAMRYRRDNEEAVLAMKEIIDSRENLIKKYKKEDNGDQ